MAVSASKWEHCRLCTGPFKSEDEISPHFCLSWYINLLFMVLHSEVKLPFKKACKRILLDFMEEIRKFSFWWKPLVFRREDIFRMPTRESLRTIFMLTLFRAKHITSVIVINGYDGGCIWVSTKYQIENFVCIIIPDVACSIVFIPISCGWSRKSPD